MNGKSGTWGKPVNQGRDRTVGQWSGREVVVRMRDSWIDIFLVDGVAKLGSILLVRLERKQRWGKAQKYSSSRYYKTFLEEIYKP